MGLGRLVNRVDATHLAPAPLSQETEGSRFSHQSLNGGYRAVEQVGNLVLRWGAGRCLRASTQAAAMEQHRAEKCGEFDVDVGMVGRR
jgi:hypothetical protein